MEMQRESIFISAMRSFSRMFFGVFGILSAFFVCSLVYSAIAPSPLLEEHTKLEILPDAEDKRELLSMSTPAILQISIHGVIGDPQNLNAGMVRNILIDSRTGLLSNSRVKGILLHFNTPGGLATDSDEIYRMLKTYKERYQIPVFGYVEGLCASGGMYIASAADQIYASPESLIGSVGVVLGPVLNFYGLMEKLGLQARTLTEGIDKDMLNPTRPYRDGEDDSLKASLAYSYRRFVDIVTAARPKLDKTKLVQQYGAQVYDCVKAEELGYIDHALSDRDAALRALLEAAHIDPAQPYQVVSLSPRRPWVSDLVSGKSPLFTGKVEHILPYGQPFLQNQIAYLYQPRG